MLSKPIQNLIGYFLKFPGVGPRQAARFTFYLLREDRAQVRAMAEAISGLQEAVRFCTQCHKTFGAPGSSENGRCELCRDTRRNSRQVMVVEKEVDLENVERARKYDGLYHVLGSTISPLDSAAPAKLHLKELFERVQSLAVSPDALEVIIATNPTAEGDATALYLARVFEPLGRQYSNLKLSRLGRGLGTGAELEYTDEVTITNALLNRK